MTETKLKMIQYNHYIYKVRHWTKALACNCLALFSSRWCPSSTCFVVRCHLNRFHSYDYKIGYALSIVVPSPGLLTSYDLFIQVSYPDVTLLSLFVHYLACFCLNAECSRLTYGIARNMRELLTPTASTLEFVTVLGDG